MSKSSVKFPKYIVENCLKPALVTEGININKTPRISQFKVICGYK